MKFNISHELNVPAEALWKHHFNPELEAVVQKEIRLQEYRVEASKQGDTTVRRVRVIPTVDMPGPLRKIMGDTIGYWEEQRVSASALRYDFKVTPDKMPDKIDVHGTFSIEPLGPDRCRRTMAGEATVKIFGVGGLAEKFLVGELERQYGDVARVQEQWIRTHEK